MIQSFRLFKDLEDDNACLLRRGKLKIKGSISAAQKFTPDIFPKPSKL
jgi:hypothetical protein